MNPGGGGHLPGLPGDRQRRCFLSCLPAGLWLGATGAYALNPTEGPSFAGTITETGIQTSDGVRLRLLKREATGAVMPVGVTVLFLPGWCMPADIWRLQLDDPERRWCAMAMDPRGQGGSGLPSTGFTADRRADDLREVIDSVDGPVVLVAWSLGVLEALQYVFRHGTGRLRGLMLVDNSIGEPPPPAGGGHFAADLKRDRLATLDRFVRSMFSRPPPEDLLQSALASARRMPVQASLALLAYPFAREHWRNIVHGVDIPLAYVVTGRFRAQAQHLLEARPASTVEIFEQAGHALFVDEADRFNALLRTWIVQRVAVSP